MEEEACPPDGQLTKVKQKSWPSVRQMQATNGRHHGSKCLLMCTIYGLLGDVSHLFHRDCIENKDGRHDDSENNEENGGKPCQGKYP